jgi:hypothetical protein
MRVTLTVSGGLAPLAMGRRYDVDVDALDERARFSFAAALEAARAEQSPPPNAVGRDVRSYEIRVVDDSRDASIVVEDGGISHAIRSLIDLIKTHSR